MDNERINFTSPMPAVLSVDGKKRVLSFLERHGGAAPDQEHEGDQFKGSCGWSEVHARDGYRLRCEWSQLGGEQKMNFLEIAP